MDNEAVRQKEYLEKVVSSLKNQLKQMEKLNKLNSAKMLRDNKVLLNEISFLKTEMMEMRKFKAKLPNIKTKLGMFKPRGWSGVGGLHMLWEGLGDLNVYSGL